MSNPVRMGETVDKVLMALTKQEAWEDLFTITYTFPKGEVEVTKKHKVSLVTNCMGRLESVKQTFLRNIGDNLDYGNVEFVLLNYGSRDDLDLWAFDNLLPYIRDGIVNYYKTTEPVYYSMTHSRNICFKVAQGDIVNNVDSDHFIKEGFAKRVNEIANQFDTQKIAFVKSRQKNRGRIGMYKDEFLKLGGYDEGIEGYGFDDQDLLARAYHLGFMLAPFGGQYSEITSDHKRHQAGNYKVKDWKYTQRRNAMISLLNLHMRRFVANEGHHWGKAHLIHNFSTEMDI